VKTVDNRLAELERELAQTQREIARRPVREAAPLAPMHGRWVGETAAALNMDGVTIAVTVSIYSRGAWEVTTLVLPNVRAFDDATPIPLSSKVYVFYYETTWVLLPFNPTRLLRGTSTEHMGETTDWQIEVTVSWFQGADPGATVIVHDPAHSWQDVPTGSEVLAFYNESDARWEVLHADRVFLYARATLDGPLCAETSMVDVTWVEGLVTGEFQLPPDTLPTVVINPRKHAGLSSDTVTLRRINNDMPSPTWEIVDVDLHLVETVIDVYLDGLDLKKKTREIYTEVCSTDETASTIDSGEEC
jgi:hypothetical protein